MRRRRQRLDRIELRGIRATGRIGVLPEERERAQPFEIDIDIDAEISSAADSDELDDTVDYAGPIATAVAVIEHGGHQLLERCAGRIAEEILTIEPVRSVEVVIRKLRPPVPHDIASTAVRVRRRQPHRVRAFVALGSNLGDRRSHLAAAVEGLPSVVGSSPVYETDPVGGPGGQEPFLNMVVELRTDLRPAELLTRCQELEQAADRVREVRWGPRTLDADVLLYGRRQIATPELIVPHPRMWDRRFVLEPLAALAPDVVPENWEELVGGEPLRRVDPL